MELKMNMFGYLVVNLIPTYPQTSVQHIKTTDTRFKRFEVRVRKQEKPILWLKITVDNIAATYLDKLAWDFYFRWDKAEPLGCKISKGPFPYLNILTTCCLNLVFPVISGILLGICSFWGSERTMVPVLQSTPLLKPDRQHWEFAVQHPSASFHPVHFIFSEWMDEDSFWKYWSL